MSLPTTITDTLIEGNIISSGYYTDGSSVFAPTYDCNLYNSSDGIVTGNSFSGQVSDVTKNMIELRNCTCIIQKNMFIRNTNDVLAYINNTTGTKEHIITNNVFDKSTASSGDESLVKGLTVQSIYEKNKNQIIYIPVSAVGGTSTANTANSGSLISDTSSTVSSTFNYLSVFWGTTGSKVYNINFDLNSVLPPSLKILEAKVGIFNVNIGSAAISSGTFSLTMYAQNMVQANYTAGVNSVLDVKNLSSTVTDQVSVSLNTFTNFAASQANTLYLTAATSSASNADNFTVTGANTLVLEIFLTNVISTLGAGLQWKISPIIVKCIW